MMIKPNSELSGQLNGRHPGTARTGVAQDHLDQYRDLGLGHLKGSSRHVGGNLTVPHTLMFLLSWLIREKPRPRTVTLETALSESLGWKRRWETAGDCEAGRGFSGGSRGSFMDPPPLLLAAELPRNNLVSQTHFLPWLGFQLPRPSRSFSLSFSSPPQCPPSLLSVALPHCRH